MRSIREAMGKPVRKQFGAPAVVVEGDTVSYRRQTYPIGMAHAHVHASRKECFLTVTGPGFEFVQSSRAGLEGKAREFAAYINSAGSR